MNCNLPRAELVPESVKMEIKQRNLLRIGTEILKRSDAVSVCQKTMAKLKQSGREDCNKYRLYEEKLKDHEEQIKKLQKESELYHSL